MNSLFETNIGLEVHAELLTETKMYCSCKNTCGKKENTVICPICTGYAGTLPSINKKAVYLTVKAGLAFNCKINRKFKMARKNYFYPDLPKGYQISQSYLPICEDGYLDIDGKKYAIANIHLEEDSGKVCGGGIDHNRCGIPLIEIVTKPCFKSPGEALDFLKELRLTLLHLGISDCKAERGSMRCDVNVSVHYKNDPLGERCELKNVSGFNNILQGILYEEKRQREIILRGEKVFRETRRWDAECMKSVLLRTKENTEDYRYFDEPDLPTVGLSEDFTDNIASKLPMLPRDKRTYYGSLGIPKQMTEDIINDIQKDRLFNECVSFNICSPKTAAVLINGAAAVFLNDNPDFLNVSDIGRLGLSLCRIGRLKESGVISSTSVKILFDEYIKSGRDIDGLVGELELEQNSDITAVKALVKQVLQSNEENVEAYKNGRTNILSYLVGQCMKLSGGKTDPVLCKECILKEIG
ncbi:MAG: Asp-tRNA(Asn)/Glu-tRNA(Gln) amidotransferase subunit GatB [Bacteroides sp.]|nr:Asp-tRNA(Asn)/Glu-tRNA(Gln) amidotransferase subunit GatB [Bacteroides sp.]